MFWYFLSRIIHSNSLWFFKGHLFWVSPFKIPGMYTIPLKVMNVLKGTIAWVIVHLILMGCLKSYCLRDSQFLNYEMARRFFKMNYFQHTHTWHTLIKVTEVLKCKFVFVKWIQNKNKSNLHIKWTSNCFHNFRQYGRPTRTWSEQHYWVIACVYSAESVLFMLHVHPPTIKWKNPSSAWCMQQW